MWLVGIIRQAQHTQPRRVVFFSNTCQDGRPTGEARKYNSGSLIKCTSTGMFLKE